MSTGKVGFELGRLREILIGCLVGICAWPVQADQFAVSAAASIPAGKFAQTITVVPTPSNKIVVGQTDGFSATANTGLPVRLKVVTPGVCTIAPSQFGNGMVITGQNLGNCVVRATQPGTVTYTATLVDTVVPIVNPPSNSLVSSLNPAPAGQPVTLTYSNAGIPIPSFTGTVQFTDSASVAIGSAAISSIGTASLTTSTLGPGYHNLTARYSGDSAHAAATSSVLTQGIGLAPTVLSVQAAPNPSLPGQPVTFTVNYSTGARTGTIALLNGQFGNLQVADGSGIASYVVSNLAAGANGYTATYSGDTAYFPAASAPLVQTVLAQPSIALASSAAASAVGQGVTFTAGVTGGDEPGGTASFYDNGVWIADATLASGGTAIALASLAAGTHTITAVYNGDAYNAGVTSGGLQQSVGSAFPQTGYWWNPAEPGRGFVIEVQDSTLLLGGFLYDVSGRSTWVSSTGQMTSAAQYSGSLLSYSGGQTLTGSYKSPTQSPSPGNVTINFTSTTQATLTWPGGNVPIQRYDFGPGGHGATPPPSDPQTGWWWNPSEGGRGFALEVQGGQVYLAGYMYDGAGNPAWYLASGSFSAAAGVQSAWQSYGNGQTLTGSFKPASVTNPNAGNVVIQFSDSAHATLTLPDGRQIPFVRFQFGQGGAGVHTGLTTLATLAGASDWETFQGNAGHTGYVPATLNPAVFGIRWTWTVPPVGSQPSSALTTIATAGGKVFFGAGGDGVFGNTGIRLYALNEFDASQSWFYDFTSIQYASVNPPAVNGGIVFMEQGQQQNTNLWAFGAGDGSVRFKLPIDTQFAHYLAPTVKNGVAYTGGGYFNLGSVYAFNIGAATRQFVQTLGGQTGEDGWTPAVDNTHAYTFVGAGLNVIDPNNGNLTVSITDPTFRTFTTPMRTAPVLGAPGSVFAVNFYNALTDFNLAGNSVAWQIAGQYAGNPAYVAGGVYATNQSPLRLEVRSETGGQLQWTWTPPVAGETAFVGDVLLAQNLVFVSTDVAVYAIDLATHQAVWSYPEPGRLALSASGILYIETVDATFPRAANGKIVAVNLN